MNPSEAWLDRFTRWLVALPHAPKGIVVDSRRVTQDDVFAALPGAHVDGRRFIDDAVERGAIGIIWEATGFSGSSSFRVPDFSLPGLAEALGVIADRIYGQPSLRLPVIGVTGTNGKTSSTHWIMQALTRLGRRTAVIGTLGNGFANGLTAAVNTTPDAAQVHELLAQFATTGAAAVAMEVSSIGLMEHRLNGVRFDTALFTNVTRDHLDYHLTMDAYIAAKERLFAWPGLKHAVINVDDPVGARLVAAAQHARVLRYSSLGNDAEIVARDIDIKADGLSFLAVTPQGEARVESSLTGAFNVENLLGVLGVLLTQGVPLADAVVALKEVQAPPGRMQRLGTSRTPTVVVDYAHTPDALERVAQALRAGLPQNRQLIGVFGCGGDRDPGKRATMGAIAGRMLDRVWITNDNPRSEDPNAIAGAILAGAVTTGNRAITVELDRAKAINAAIAAARFGDMVLIAGKGHEPYQEINGVKKPFSDCDTANHALAAWDAAHGMQISLSALAAAAGGELLGADQTIQRVVTDTRMLTVGDLFVALKGERFDGHDFVAPALKLGAAAMIDRAYAASYSGQPVIVVDDPRAALGRMARHWRQQQNAKVAVVVGSNGKTTVKEMTACLTRAHFGDAAVHATPGNLNNAIGLPLSLLQLRPQHRVAVIELGMNHRGETSELAAIALPDVAVINNAQREHQEFMKDVATVAEEHGDLLNDVAANGVAVLNGDDEHLAVWLQRARKRGLAVMTFGTHAATAAEHSLIGHIEANAEGSRLTATLKTPASGAEGAALHRQETITTQVPLFGEAMAMNALAAISVAQVLGTPLHVAASALPTFTAVAGRLARQVLPNGMILIDDAYNANPDSVQAAIRVLMTQPVAERWLVLGDMGEVGDHGVAFHEEVGAAAKAAGVSRLWATGPLMASACRAFGAHAQHFEKRADLIVALLAALAVDAPGVLLIKGSRFMGMEAVVNAVKENLRTKHKDIEHVAVAQ